MRANQRQELRSRFGFRCGYCGVSDVDAGAELTLDHFQPSTRGGRDDPDNWVYCCHACNEFKGDYWQPGGIERVLHPLRDDLEKHVFEDEEGLLQALTPIGAFHIDKLRLNRPGLVIHRRRDRLRAALRQIQAEFRQYHRHLDEALQLLTEELARRGRGDLATE